MSSRRPAPARLPLTGDAPGGQAARGAAGSPVPGHRAVPSSSHRVPSFALQVAIRLIPYRLGPLRRPLLIGGAAAAPRLVAAWAAWPGPVAPRAAVLWPDAAPSHPCAAPPPDS